MFDFSDLIEKYSVPFVAYPKRGGRWADNADWIPGEKMDQVNLTGVFLPLTKDDLRYSESGTYNVQDRKILTTQVLEFGQKVEYDEITYTIQNNEDYSDYGNFNIYYARWAGNESSSS